MNPPPMLMVGRKAEVSRQVRSHLMENQERKKNNGMNFKDGVEKFFYQTNHSSSE